ncbi:hypothetical protein EXS70_00300 [Candidatus Peribacteria bacterium]|nr:hypothetical protein [Candidatus Peribacteria bacterium]
MQLQRLRGRKVCDRLIRHGNAWKGRHMHVRWLVGAPRHPAAKDRAAAIYVGTLASTKLDKSAVKRNRMRRRCREALRLSLKELPEISQSLQLLIAPRSSSLSAPFPALQQDIQSFFSLHARSTQAQ